jgi:hypothetical protein
MKILFSLILTIFALTNANTQVYQVTGPDLSVKITQLQKTNDSLKAVLTSNKILIEKYKKDSINYRNWVSTKNSQMWAKMDSIKVLKNTVSQYNSSISQFITGDQLASFGNPSGFYMMGGDGKAEPVTFFGRSMRDALPTDQPFQIYIGLKVGTQMRYYRMMDPGL